jgi:hypothetical protein
MCLGLTVDLTDSRGFPEGGAVGAPFCVVVGGGIVDMQYHIGNVSSSDRFVRGSLKSADNYPALKGEIQLYKKEKETQVPLTLLRVTLYCLLENTGRKTYPRPD